MIRRGFSLLACFPSWLASLKHMVSWFRDENLREETAEKFENRGQQGLGAMVRPMSLANFAAWRWSTLEFCCNGFAGSLHSIIANLNAQEFADKRDRVKLRAVADALASDLWMQRFSFVLMYSKWLGSALRWGGSCHCHQAQYLANEDVRCSMKGRF